MKIIFWRRLHTIVYYLTGTTKHSLPDLFGFMLTPKKGLTTLSEDPTNKRVWAVDNGAFSGKFNEKLFFNFLERMLPYQDRCLFCACPDVMLDPIKTYEQFIKYSERIKDLGYPVAFIAQDGQENLSFPEDFDWLFIGGSTEWKMSQSATDCIIKANSIGKKIHIGRVNSYKRLKHFQPYGIKSVDGNKLKYAPDAETKRIISWFIKLGIT